MLALVLVYLSHWEAEKTKKLLDQIVFVAWCLAALVEMVLVVMGA